MAFEGIYCFGTASVRFAVYPDGLDGARVLASVKVEVLRDRLGVLALDRGPLEACRENYSLLEKAAVARFRNDSCSPIDLQLHELEAVSHIALAVAQPRPPLITIVPPNHQARSPEAQRKVPAVPSLPVRRHRSAELRGDPLRPVC